MTATKSRPGILDVWREDARPFGVYHRVTHMCEIHPTIFAAGCVTTLQKAIGDVCRPCIICFPHGPTKEY